MITKTGYIAVTCLLLSTLLACMVFCGMSYSIARANSIYVISYSPDGQTPLVSDGEYVYVTRNGVETTLNQPNIIAFTWMDNTSALMNRTDYGVLIINVITGQVFWLGYNYPNSYCSPCNIGGEG